MSERVTIEVEREWLKPLRDGEPCWSDIIFTLVDRIEAALPEEEPKGQGAVVEWCGVLYMRDRSRQLPWRDGWGAGRTWEEIAPKAKVLFEGVDE